MVNKIYSLYNRLSKRYGDVVAYPTDAYASHEVSFLLSKNPNMASEISLYCIGEVDISNGTVSPIPPYEIELSTQNTVDNMSESD